MTPLRGCGSTLHAAFARTLPFAGAPDQAQDHRNCHHFQLENRFTATDLPDLCIMRSAGSAGSLRLTARAAAQTYFRQRHPATESSPMRIACLIQHPSYSQSYRIRIGRSNPHTRFWMRWGNWQDHQRRVDRSQGLSAQAGGDNIDAGEAPYIRRLVRDRLVQHLGDTDSTVKVCAYTLA